MSRALILEEIKEANETIKRLEKELRESRPKPFMFIDDWGDKCEGMWMGCSFNDEEGKDEEVVCMGLEEISMCDIPAVVAWLNKVIGE